MALCAAPFLLLVLVTVALWESCFGASSHSLKYFSKAISDPTKGQPQYITVGYLDGQNFVHYDSNSRTMKLLVSWIEKYVGKEDPQYCERETRRERGIEEAFREGMEILRSRYNQSEGLYTWQRIYGCELRRDGSKGGFEQFGYERRTFITFDMENHTWVSSEPNAQITHRRWNALPGYNQRDMSYLEETCIEWLEKSLSYGNETLLRTEPINSESNMGLIIVCVVAALVLVLVVFVLLAFMKHRIVEEFKKRQNYYNAAPKKCQDNYKAAPGSDRGSTGSDQALISGTDMDSDISKQEETPSIKREE